MPSYPRCYRAAYNTLTWDNVNQRIRACPCMTGLMDRFTHFNWSPISSIPLTGWGNPCSRPVRVPPHRIYFITQLTLPSGLHHVAIGVSSNMLGCWRSHSCLYLVFFSMGFPSLHLPSSIWFIWILLCVRARVYVREYVCEASWMRIFVHFSMCVCQHVCACVCAVRGFGRNFMGW